MSASFTLAKLAQEINATLEGDGAVEVTRLVHPATFQSPAELVLAMDDKLLPLLQGKTVSAAVVSVKAPRETAQHILRVTRPRLALSRLTNLFALPPDFGTGVHSSAVVAATAKLGKHVVIGPHCIVGAGAVIGDRCILQSNVIVEAGAIIGADTVLRAGVCIGAACVIGARCLLHFNCSIGSDGFSFVTAEKGSVEAAKSDGSVTATNSQGWLRIASLGAVIIGDDVEIGANTSIDRGTIVDTRIGRGTKIDNQVQIGHNVQIGEDCLLCGRVGLAGSVELGNRVVIGGASGLADHVKVGDDAVIMSMSGVGTHVPPRQVYGGAPAIPRERAVEQHLAINRLKSLVNRVDNLDASVKALEQKAESR